MTYTMDIETRPTGANGTTLNFPYVVTDTATGEVIGHYETRAMAQSVARQWRAATRSYAAVSFEAEA